MPELQQIVDRAASEERKNSIRLYLGKRDENRKAQMQWVMSSTAEDLAVDLFHDNPDSSILNAHVVDHRTAEWRSI